MAEHDYIIDNGTGSAVRTDLNNALAAIASNNSKATDLTTNYAYQWYADTGDNTLKIRNAANDGYVNVSITGGIGTENFGLAPIASPTFTTSIKLADNGKALFGTGDDLEIYHDGGNSVIDNNTGELKIQSDNFRFLSSDGTEYFADFNVNGNVELYYDNSKTFETTASGFSAIGGTFTGDVVLDNQSDLRFEEATANGSNYIALQAPAAIASNVTLTLPAVAPTAGQALLADSSTPTTLTWGSAAGVGGATGIDFNDDVAIRFGGSNDGVIQYVSSTDAFTISTADGADITTTGAIKIPVGTTAERPGSPATGDLRFNSTLTAAEIYNGSSFVSVGGGATGGGSDQVFIENQQTVTTNYTLTTNNNAMSTGPITVNSGITVTIPSGSRYVIL